MVARVSLCEYAELEGANARFKFAAEHSHVTIIADPFPRGLAEAFGIIGVTISVYIFCPEVLLAINEALQGLVPWSALLLGDSAAPMPLRGSSHLIRSLHDSR